MIGLQAAIQLVKTQTESDPDELNAKLFRLKTSR